MNNSALEFIPELLKLCFATTAACARYEETPLSEVGLKIARGVALEKYAEAVGAHHLEIARVCDGYRRAVWALQDIAAMGRKAGSETAAHMLAQLREPRLIDQEERQESA